ncbi:unnamed protein product [Moneuplotes crassus]|uniref:Rab-GAP TBC domain-containing protein n=1 Tax=Euplotes crassus TaxID=5936 RepID=A0AAD1TZ36_EUPCR|nr:unnamed protein product [Moneuplotes crassus]
MDPEENKGLSSNPLGRMVFQKEKFIDFFLKSENCTLEQIKEQSRHGNLAEECGSRLHSWRVLLGLVPFNTNPETWIKKIRKHRKRFYKISDRYSIENTKNMDPMACNPLMSSTGNLWNELMDDKDMKDTIMKDVVRTYQEYKFFQRKKVRDQMVSTLYFWSKTYPMYSYRQGMNEIIAVIYFVFAAEKVQEDIDIDQLSDSEIASDHDNLIKFLYNTKHMNADVFIIFERVMSMGIKELYGTIDDLTTIKGKLDTIAKEDKDRMFKWKYEVEQEEKDRRAKIEQMYDDERKKSAVMRRCNRIYHNYLKRVDTEVYKHLISIKLDPELQLMRWLRCILSREFDIEISLSLWDYIFSGINDEFRKDRDFGDMYYTEDYFASTEDPLINLDYLCLAMIENIRDKIYKQEMEDCLEVFFHYPEVKGASRLISVAGKIEKAVINGTEVESSSVRMTPTESEAREDLKEQEIYKDEVKEEKTTKKSFSSESDFKCKEPKEETKEVVKTTPTSFYDPLSNFNSKTKFPSKGIPAAKPQKEEEGFVSKRIGDMKTPKNEKEDDLNHPLGGNLMNKNAYSQKNHQHITYEKEENHDSMVHQHSSSQEGITGEKVIGTLMGGINMINQKRREYVDPLVKKGLNSVQNQINQRSKRSDEELQHQRVLYEKLKKVKAFLDKLKEGGSHDEGDHHLINLDVDEENLSDVQLEVDTMIQMTYTRPNYD